MKRKKMILYRIFHSARGLIFLVILVPLFAYMVKNEGDRNSVTELSEEVRFKVIPSKITDKVLSTEKSTIMKKETKLNFKKEARIPPLPMSEIPEEWAKTLERLPGAGLKGVNTPVNVFGTLMYSPETMGSFLEYWVTSKLKMGFSGREQELVILRMGFLYNCNYVWKHHVPVAKEYGVTDKEIEAVKSSPLPSVFSEREHALLVLTEEMVEHRTIRDEVWSKWSGQLKESEMVDLISLVSQYVLFALLNNAIQVEIEEPLKEIPGL